MIRFFSTTILFASLVPGLSASYYVDNSGSDGNSGMTGSPWQHVGHALANVPSGSSLYLTSGQTFTEDNLVLTNTSQVLITSSGTAPAILRNATTGTNPLMSSINTVYLSFNPSQVGRDVLTIINANQITLSNLCFYGTGVTNTANWACVDIIYAGAKKCTNITIVNCEMTNANFGISIYANGLANPSHAFDNLAIIGNSVHEIGWDGILEWNPVWTDGSPIICSNPVTALNNVFNVTGRPDVNSGTGIALFAVSHWECYSNNIYDCGIAQGYGGGGGAGGIFPVYSSDHVHIWNNTIWNIYAKPNGDGVGIDLDRHTRDSIVEGNFVHDCGGSGYYSYQAGGNNIWRWNIGINDGSGKSNPGLPQAGRAPEMWFADIDPYLLTNSCEYVYNNTLIGNNTAFESDQSVTIPNTALILNNIFGQLAYKDAYNNPIPLVVHNRSLSTNWYFAGNDYYSTNFFIVANGSPQANYFAMADWQAGGQEAGTGFTHSPGFAVGSGNIASNYLLKASSILRGVGIDVRAYGLNPGTMDYLGKPVLSSGNNVGGLAGVSGTGTYYFLTVINGLGSGNYTNGGTAAIAANTVPGSYFTGWAGARVADASLASTELTIYSNTTVTANFAQPVTPSMTVTNYGAVGDLVYLANVCVTSNSASIICPTASFTANDINKTMEIFGGGAYQGPSNQCLIAIINNYINSTNVMVSLPAGVTATNLRACYGTDNSIGFSNAIAALPPGSATLVIPAGNYLFIPAIFRGGNLPSSSSDTTAFVSVNIPRGGITFLGEGNVTLTGNGAWVAFQGPWGAGPAAYRGMMFSFNMAPTNDYPVTFSNLTFYGGTSGYDGHHEYQPALAGSGIGWDESHHAIVAYTTLNSGINLVNCTFNGWRGEMVIDGSSYTNGFMMASNCSFYDGNATALNVNMAHNWAGCTFSNLYQVEEFYMGYAVAPSWLQNSVITNIYGNQVAINGALANGVNATYTIQNNSIYGALVNGIETCPAQNLVIRSNLFVNDGLPIVIGCAGYQGTAINSNIIVVANIFTNCYATIFVEGTGANRVDGLLVSNNVAYGLNGYTTSFADGYGWGTNMVFVGNTTSAYQSGLLSGSMSGQWFKDDASNQFPIQAMNDPSAQSNVVSYAQGMFHLTSPYFNTNSIFVLDDTHPQQIPPGANLVVTNSGTHSGILYLSQTMSGTPITLTNGYSRVFSWKAASAKWLPKLTAPTNLRSNSVAAN